MAPPAGRFDPAEVEPRWIKAWEETGALRADPASDKPPFTIAIPPPNVTGALHMGHALNNTIQDLLIRRRRMEGAETMWICGTDHAGIATQAVVEKQLAAEGLDRRTMGREAFERRVWEWKEEYGGTIISQLRRLGATLDYSRERFTMDGGYADAVLRVFVALYEKGVVYRDDYMVNWDPGLRSAISDLEVINEEVEDTLLEIAYPLTDGSGEIVVATVRPETMLGDTAVAVHPEDERYGALVGRTCTLPLVGREIPIIADDYIDPEFGTGALKVTPAHDMNDFEMGRRHGLEAVGVIGEDGTITDAAPEAFRGMSVAEASVAVTRALRDEGRVRGETAYVHSVPFSHRSGERVEPLISLQWFADMSELAQPAIAAVEQGAAALRPRALGRGLPHVAARDPSLVPVAPALVGPSAAGLVPRRGGVRRPRGADGRRLGSATRTSSTPGSARRCGRSPPSAGPSGRRSSSASTRPRSCPRRGTSSSSGSRAW